jgi:hypothetical protein
MGGFELNCVLLFDFVLFLLFFTSYTTGWPNFTPIIEEYVTGQEFFFFLLKRCNLCVRLT